MNSNEASGGFILSPPPSSVTSTSTSATSILPHPRGTPLRAGGSKESAFIRHVDQQILHIQRRFAKRTSPNTATTNGVPSISHDNTKADAWGDVKGYSSMRQACKDIEELVGVVWVSGTPSLQIPYLLSLGLLVGTVVADMPPSRKGLFRVVGKLDHAFASLIQGRDVDTGERLPGFEGRRGVSGTEKVRIRSLVERTRVGVVEAFKRGEFEEEPVDVDEMDVGTDVDMEMEGELVLEGDDLEGAEEEEESYDMQLARVYDRTIQELGDSLEAPSIGIITEKRG
ncbi:hypothetical protein LTR36_004685 [Oleoguttula mirabilis]|uniref:Uncharacterized protein n=1 Tax=Oleoguttula mirabilis TaxID=1507867 RepID=A0AAV9JFS6_9PEZI|nr:hypothetical protein LTR36_004685 [Oleoguttula mirabilis]